MSELDAFFEPQEVSHMTYSVGRTNWPRQPEHLRHILDAFQQEAGFEPIGALKQTWISGAKAWHSVFGENTTLLRLSVEYMRQKELMIASPRSCITVAVELQRKEMPKDYSQGYEPCEMCGAISCKHMVPDGDLNVGSE